MKKSIIKYLLLFFVLVTCWPVLDVNKALAQDTTAVEQGKEVVYQQRKIKEESLQLLSEDSSMDYTLYTPQDTFWSKLKNWLARLLNKIFSTRAGGDVINGIIYLVCILAILFVLLRIFNIDISNLFVRSSKKLKNIQVHHGLEENIHEIDFAKLVKEAVREQEYNKATRLVYLASLKQLADASLIDWRAGKTNHQYQAEMQRHSLADVFSELGYYFEYAWYGDFKITPNTFSKVDELYNTLSKNLQGKA